ncbi:hypothetical protein D3C80_1833310 [compost metagenome]
MEFVIEHKNGTEIFSLTTGSQFDSIVEVGGSIGADNRPRSHRTSYDYGFRTSHG